MFFLHHNLALVACRRGRIASGAGECGSADGHWRVVPGLLIVLDPEAVGTWWLETIWWSHSGPCAGSGERNVPGESGRPATSPCLYQETLKSCRSQKGRKQAQ